MTTDYEDLYFRPEMTWKELCQKWRKYYHKKEDCLKVHKPVTHTATIFKSNGNIVVVIDRYDCDYQCHYPVESDVADNATCKDMDELINTLDRIYNRR